MSRIARQYCSTGVYHIVFRGICKQNIFEENIDYEKILVIIQNLKDEMKFKLFAYCLMSNHVHLLIKEESHGDISKILQRLLTKYAGWFNKKYDRNGVLFENRYKSQAVEYDEYLFSVIRYIHQNPIKANIVANASEYRWSSYFEYVSENKLVDTDFMLSIFNIRRFEELHQKEELELIEVNDKFSRSEEYIRNRIMKLTGGREPHEIGKLPKSERNKLLRLLRLDEGFSIRQIERTTGVCRGIIAKVDK